MLGGRGEKPLLARYAADEVRICHLQREPSYRCQQDVMSMRESCRSYGKEVTASTRPFCEEKGDSLQPCRPLPVPTPGPQHAASGSGCRGAFAVKSLSRNQVKCSALLKMENALEEWGVICLAEFSPRLVKAWRLLALLPSQAELRVTGPHLMPAQCKWRSKRLFPLMCVTKHAKRIFSLRSSGEWNFFKKTCWLSGFAKDRSHFQAKTKEEYGVLALF